MYFKKETENQYLPFEITCLEAKTGGYILGIDDLGEGIGDELPGGALLAPDSNGVGRLVKTAALHADATDSATTYQVEKGHAFKVGQVVVNTALDGAAVAIDAIDTTNADYDVITVSATIGVALVAGKLLIEASAVATAGNGAFKYKPEGISRTKIDLTVANQSTGLMVRGTVNEANLASYVDDSIKALLPHIIFEQSIEE